MEEDVKNLISAMIYYELATGFGSFDTIIRKFNYIKGKDFLDEYINILPEDKNIAKKYYNKVSGENFEEIKLISFTKMAMFEIKEKIEDWKFLTDEEQVDKFVCEICKMDNNNVEKFINDNAQLLTDDIKKYGFYFAILYMYLLSKKENENNVEYLKKEIDLIENIELHSIFQDNDIVSEKYRYLLIPYDNLVWELKKNEQYDLAEEYFKKYINLLEEYLKIHSDSYQAQSYLSSTYYGYACVLWDSNDGVNDKSDELIYKSIEVKKKIIENNPDKKSHFYDCIAIDYSNMAYEYKKAYKKNNIEKYKEMYYEQYKKAIYYREEINKIDEFKNIDEKINNYIELGKMYYFIFEDDKSKEYFNTALEICQKEDNSDDKWIEKINKWINK